MDRKSAMKKLSLIAALLVSVVIFTGEVSAQGRITRPTKPKTETEHKTESKTQNKPRPTSATPQLSPEEMYQKGEVAYKQDRYSEAVKWYRKAAEQGHVAAQYMIGYLYYEGLGVSKDYSESARWYWFAAHQGHARALCSLGYMYQEGLGVPMDTYGAVKLYSKSAEQGLASAQYHLGYAYENGIGVFSDSSEAINWYRKAAGQGHAKAISKLKELGESY